MVEHSRKRINCKFKQGRRRESGREREIEEGMVDEWMDSRIFGWMDVQDRCGKRHHAGYA